MHIAFQKIHPRNVPEPCTSHRELTSSSGFTTSPVIMDIAKTVKKTKPGLRQALSAQACDLQHREERKGEGLGGLEVVRVFTQQIGSTGFEHHIKCGGTHL